MKKEWLIKTLVVGIILFFICMSIIPSFAFDNVKKSLIPFSDGNILYVGGDGPGNYSTINEAIDNASDGDSIYVYNGTYNERLRINKQLFIKGIQNLSGEYPIIKGSTDYETVIIYADGCILENLGVIHGHRGVIFSSNNNTITNCTIQRTGIALLISSFNNNTIINNTMTIGSTGIKTSGSNNTFYNNNIHDHADHEFEVGGQNNYFFNNIASNSKTGNGFEVYGNNCLFSGNVIKSNRIYGFHLAKSYNNTLINNTFNNNGLSISGDIEHLISHTIENNFINNKPIYFIKNKQNIEINSDAGQVFLINCTNCIIKNLDIHSSGIGIYLLCSSNNTIIKNKITSTWQIGIYLLDSHNNVISDNFIQQNSYGIRLGKSNNNEIFRNIILDNNIGVCFDQNSNSNEIFLNDLINFIENEDINAISDGINIWDNGKRGNYWCDYWLLYPWAPIIWIKGVYSIPYELDEQNKDNYPLVRPHNLFKSREYKNVLFFDVFLKRFLEQFPNALPILRYILEFFKRR